jgi:hypothetical protein
LISELHINLTDRQRATIQGHRDAANDAFWSAVRTLCDRNQTTEYVPMPLSMMSALMRCTSATARKRLDHQLRRGTITLVQEYTPNPNGGIVNAARYTVNMGRRDVRKAMR